MYTLCDRLWAQCENVHPMTYPYVPADGNKTVLGTGEWVRFTYRQFNMYRRGSNFKSQYVRHKRYQLEQLEEVQEIWLFISKPPLSNESYLSVYQEWLRERSERVLKEHTKLPVTDCLVQRWRNFLNWKKNHQALVSNSDDGSNLYRTFIK